ncbi:MAG: B12-binding domain-containing radical SAM protein [Thermoplasmata archaeon]|nr:B12-binding domain-containing radical SAM protein [Thermoplasmata archaeon]
MGRTNDRPRAEGASAPRVLLVDPYLAREDPMERKSVELYPSLGILNLAAFLRDHGAQVQVTDLTFARSARPVGNATRSFRPHIVGVHTKSLTYPRAVEIAAMAREGPALAVAGGPDAATRPELYLDSGFDVVVTGEGEVTLAELARKVADGESTADIPGTVVRSGGSLHRNPSRPFLQDLDALPLPAWDLVDMEGYLHRWEQRTGERRAALLTSRGCPFDCSWCSKPAFGRSFRQQSPGRVLDEVEALVKRYRVDYLRFCDDVFGIQRRWLEELLDGLEARQLHLKFECLARVDLLKPDLLARMRRAGLERVYLGVESGSQKMLDVMNRGTRLAQVESIAQALRREQVRQFWFLMLGYPGETLEDIEATLRLFRRFSPEEYSVSIAVPIPGTRFYESVRDRLRGVRARSRKGGVSLLYEAAYPQSLYRWEQYRFDWSAHVQRLRGRLDPSVLAELESAADRFHARVAEPLLLGTRLPAPPRRESPGRRSLRLPPRLDALRAQLARQRPFR